jgi:hypothetical protein
MTPKNPRERDRVPLAVEHDTAREDRIALVLDGRDAEAELELRRRTQYDLEVLKRSRIEAEVRHRIDPGADDAEGLARNQKRPAGAPEGV